MLAKFFDFIFSSPDPTCLLRPGTLYFLTNSFYCIGAFLSIFSAYPTHHAPATHKPGHSLTHTPTRAGARGHPSSMSGLSVGGGHDCAFGNDWPAGDLKIAAYAGGYASMH
jgi:hypothetical protein